MPGDYDVIYDPDRYEYSVQHKANRPKPNKVGEYERLFGDKRVIKGMDLGYAEAVKLRDKLKANDRRWGG